MSPMAIEKAILFFLCAVGTFCG